MEIAKDKPEFKHFNTKKTTNCQVCLRVLHKGDLVKALVKDDKLLANIQYCPSGVKHIETPNDYKNYLIEVLQVERNKEFTVKQIFEMIKQWELFRIRKGYLNPALLSQVTPEHKQAWKETLKYNKRKLDKAYHKLRKENKEKEQDIIQQMAKLQGEIDDAD